MKLKICDDTLLAISENGLKAQAIIPHKDGFAFNVDEIRVVIVKPTADFTLSDVCIRLEYCFNGRVMFERGLLGVNFGDEIGLRGLSAQVPFTISSN